MDAPIRGYFIIRSALGGFKEREERKKFQIFITLIHSPIEDLDAPIRGRAQFSDFMTRLPVPAIVLEKFRGSLAVGRESSAENSIRKGG